MMKWLRFTLLIALNVHFIQFTVSAPSPQAPTEATTVAPSNPTASTQGTTTNAPPATATTSTSGSGTTSANQNPTTQPSNQTPATNPNTPTPNNQMPNQNNFMPPWAGNTGLRGSLDQLWGMTMNVGMSLGNMVNNIVSGTFNAVGSLLDNIFGMGVINGQNTATYNNQIGPQFQRP